MSGRLCPRCRQPVAVASTSQHKVLLVNPEPDTQGLLIRDSVDHTGVWICRVVAYGSAPGRIRYSAHKITCAGREWGPPVRQPAPSGPGWRQQEMFE